MKKIMWYILVDDETNQIKLDFYDRNLLIFESKREVLNYTSKWHIQNVKVVVKEFSYDDDE
jgi:vacuolar-type H+-ATPase subunit C/Vma6